eukprot:scaffold196836_cov28-Tisochrysis_lutea.AAC.1
MCLSHTLSNAGEQINLPALIEEWMTPWLELVGGRDPHRGAQSLWAHMVAPQRPKSAGLQPGEVWWSKAEICFDIAENSSHLKTFVRLLQARAYGSATTAKLSSILQSRFEALQQELAALLDMRELVKVTYEMEGDRLELLLAHRRLEALLAFGDAVASNQSG